MDIVEQFEPTTHTMMFMLIFHYFMKLAFNTTVKKELKENKHLESKIQILQIENSYYYKTLMCFKYWGITPGLNFIGFIVMTFEYIF